MSNPRKYPDDDWNKTKKEMKEILINLSKNRSLITYLELTEKIKTINFNVRASYLYKMLDEVSLEENEAKRGLLSAVVVRKDTYEPGKGFYELIEKRKRNALCDIECWRDAVRKVHNYWVSQGKKNAK